MRTSIKYRQIRWSPCAQLFPAVADGRRRNGSGFKRPFSALLRMGCIGAFLLSLAALPAAAQEALESGHPAAQETPIHIQADQLITNRQANTAVFSGHVRATQGDSIITADTLTVHYRGTDDSDVATGMDAIVRIVAEGDVQIVMDEQTAYTARADYIAEKRLVVLTGAGSKIVSGKNTISGQKITLYRDDGRIQVEGSADAPVEAFFYSNETGMASPDTPNPE